ncbi:MAG: RsmE family RNA methyltransferase [Phycisphaeraceae bacterium JB051]
MRRFYVGQSPTQQAVATFSVGLSVELDPQQSKHAWKVLRMQVGDRVQLVDGTGQLAVGQITQCKPVMAVQILEVTQVPPLLPRITLACAMPKGGRADDMVNQLCQLGVDELIPINTERSVVEAKPNKLDRFERIIAEASKQCGRTHGMMISQPMDLTALAHRQFDEKRIGLPTGEQLDVPNPEIQTLLMLIGPEGGFTDQEMQWAKDQGFKSWQFAPYVLRIETAAAASVAILRTTIKRH